MKSEKEELKRSIPGQINQILDQPNVSLTRYEIPKGGYGLSSRPENPQTKKDQDNSYYYRKNYRESTNDHGNQRDLEKENAQLRRELSNWQTSKDVNLGFRKDNQKCFNCNNYGHIARDCRIERQQQFKRPTVRFNQDQNRSNGRINQLQNRPWRDDMIPNHSWRNNFENQDRSIPYQQRNPTIMSIPDHINAVSSPVKDDNTKEFDTEVQVDIKVK